jgi:iron-sulfur cluster assembly protein
VPRRFKSFSPARTTRRSPACASGVRGGGCSGFQYLLAFDEQRDGDTVVTERGIKLLVDNASIPYVQGSTIDYVESLQGAGFQVNNPNVVAACGCGSSFRVAEEEEVSAL